MNFINIMYIGSNTPEWNPVADNLFKIDSETGEIRLNQDARGFYGTWLVTFVAYDHGHLWESQIQLNSSETYEITIEPQNFNEPILLSPTTGKTHRLRYFNPF